MRRADGAGEGPAGSAGLEGRGGPAAPARPTPGRDWAAYLAQRVWLARGAASARRFADALARPAEVQASWLQRRLAEHARSEVGETHGFSALRMPKEFARAVPVSTYADLAPRIDRIRRGERDVLAVGRVSHLAPTSGSTGARKLIPFTAGLQRAFDAAVAPWLRDVVRERTRVLDGPAYWSVSPLVDNAADAGEQSRRSSAPPIGFADDAAYLGGAAAWLVRQAMAVPSAVRFVRNDDAFWALTALALLRHRGLRMISVWHPSFLELLVGAAHRHWSSLLEAIARDDAGPWADALPATARSLWAPGEASVASSPTRASSHAKARAAELRALGPDAWPAWWPALEVVSCWGEQAAAAGHARLRAQLPGVLVQAKGLLATEGVVTIPYHGQTPLAVTSHFFEFLDDAGDARLAHELERGKSYEALLTNGAGLWRYRLGDVVECTGFLDATPSLRFLGRAERASDLRGEKLSEVFVADVLRALWPAGPPAYAALRPWDDGVRAGYELVVSADGLRSGQAAAGSVHHGPGRPAPALAEDLEARLCANPHYALARRLGQMDALRVAVVDASYAAAELAASGGRLGDVKPRVLLPARTTAPARPDGPSRASIPAAFPAS